MVCLEGDGRLEGDGLSSHQLPPCPLTLQVFRHDQKFIGRLGRRLLVWLQKGGSCTVLYFDRISQHDTRESARFDGRLGPLWSAGRLSNPLVGCRFEVWFAHTRPAVKDPNWNAANAS